MIGRFNQIIKLIMNRGPGNFICAECGNVFEAEMWDWRHMCTIAPAKCPNCGSWYTIPDGEDLEHYKIIWKRDDEERSIVREDYDISPVIVDKIRSFCESLK